MTAPSRAGRPKSSSRETLAEAACELFLEQGYDATSVADITRRAGVSRSSFFNYFSSKSDVLWSGLDTRIAEASDALASLANDADAESVREILRETVRGFAPDPLALALRNRSAMGLDDELVRDTGVRQIRLASAISEAARSAGMGVIRADIIGAAYAAALFSSLRVWAEQGAGTGSPEIALEGALGGLDELRWT
ncbi:TetR/AcrR family transcriptional regulator [Microbacterium sp. ZW T5_45]|uniref:TetR/AcrR family transcriptional regulator n=1 Tax=Microbacterium sp. ZW T5_45 TaxID=3378080 RepID=UPI0038531690